MKTSIYLQTEHIWRGLFYTSPLIVAVQEQGPRLPPKRRVCHNLSKGDKMTNMGSVNSFIMNKEVPTCFDLAFRVAQVVSVLFALCSLVWISA